MEAPETSGTYLASLRADATYLAKDYIRTSDGAVWAVVAPRTESERVRCFLRYVPTSGDSGLEKVNSHQANLWVETHRREWLFHSRQFDAVCHGIPVQQIADHIRPQTLNEVVWGPQLSKPHLPSSTALRKVAEALLPSNVQVHLTGSWLLGLAGKKSDFDLVVYGQDEFRRLVGWVEESLKADGLEPLTDSQWQDTYDRRGCDLDFPSYLWHERRKSNKACVEGHRIDLSCVDVWPDIACLPGTKIGKRRFTARVIAAHQSHAVPAVYHVDNESIPWVVSFTPTYVSQARAGELIEVSGWEETIALSKRLVVGTSREASGEFIRVCSDS